MPPPPSYTLEIITAEGINYRLAGGHNVKISISVLSMEFYTDTEPIGEILYRVGGLNTMPPSPTQCTLVLQDDYHGEVWRSPDPSRTFYNAYLTMLCFGELGGPFILEPFILEPEWTYQECDFTPRRLRRVVPSPEKPRWQKLGF